MEIEQLEKVVKYAGLDLNKYSLELIFNLKDALSKKKEELTVGEIDKIKGVIVAKIQTDQLKAQG